MKILAIDLGKNKSVFVLHDTASGTDVFGKLATTPAALHDLLVEHTPDRLVIEVGPAAGWICDLAEALGVAVEVANTNDERWHWKRVKCKTDQQDAVKLARLSAMSSLPTVHVPCARVRQWRALIEYRHALVGRRTAIKNTIRSIFERQGRSIPGGNKAWTMAGLQQLAQEAQQSEGSTEQLWRFQLQVELQLLASLQQQIDAVEAKLAELAAEDDRVKLLRTAPQVGPRLSELVVAVLDDPHRFASARQVASYAGLTPQRRQSGESDRSGHITKAGNRLLRAMLTEIAWLGVAANTWMKRVYENVRRGSDARKKLAITAVARRLLTRLWAMLRDHQPWQEPRAIP